MPAGNASRAVPVVTRVASSATVVNLGSLNNTLSRGLFTVFNESTSILYVMFGPAASLTNYTVQVPAGAYYEVPQPIYRGQITGIWAAANGFAQVTEA